jgi:ADP-ribosyl-[dinitrogen reductase] hydrolase
LGLPAEGLSRSYIARRWPGPWKHRFIFGRGMVSDDTEHTLFVAQSLLLHPDNAADFQRTLAWKFRWWLLCLPAGIGFATLRAILKLWLGFGCDRSGVFSAGNGPAMRSAIIGAYFANDPEKLSAYVRASTRLTHTDPKAEIAALAVARTAAHLSNGGSIVDPDLLPLWRACGADDPEWQAIMDQIQTAMEAGGAAEALAKNLGLEKGVSGYAYHTVPVSLYLLWLHRGDYQSAVENVIRCGGDTDTTAAITGGLAALSSDIPRDWVDGVWDWPCSVEALRALGLRMENGQESGHQGGLGFAWILLPIRNLIFFLIILAHVVRRVLPV